MTSKLIAAGKCSQKQTRQRIGKENAVVRNRKNIQMVDNELVGTQIF